MGSGKKYWLICLITVAAGIALHSLYDLLPIAPVAIFAPVQESLWEHVKLLYWPYLISSLLLCRGRQYRLRPRLLTLLLMCACLLAISYWYHILLGGRSVVVDIGLYLFLMVSGFVLPFFFSGPYKGRGWEAAVFLTVLLGGMIVLFTFLPPAGLLFADLSGAETWSQIPC